MQAHAFYGVRLSCYGSLLDGVERLLCLQMPIYWLRGGSGGRQRSRHLDRRELWPSFARDSTTAV
jgi:hypothetical protein